MAAKGPQGNIEQLKIALELKQGLTSKEVSEKLGKPLITVQKLKKKIGEGWKPDLSEAALAAAPPSPGKLVPGGGKGTVSHGENPSGKADTEQAPGADEKKADHAAPGYISLAAIQIRSQYTPIMYMARLAAEDKWGWSGSIPYEDFIDICLYHFFKDRGITLQGYIVDKEVAGAGNGNAEEMKELQGQMKELLALVKGGKNEGTG